MPTPIYPVLFARDPRFEPSALLGAPAFGLLIAGLVCVPGLRLPFVLLGCAILWIGWADLKRVARGLEGQTPGLGGMRLG